MFLLKLMLGCYNWNSPWKITLDQYMTFYEVLPEQRQTLRLRRQSLKIVELMKSLRRLDDDEIEW